MPEFPNDICFKKGEEPLKKENDIPMNESMRNTSWVDALKGAEKLILDEKIDDALRVLKDIERTPENHARLAYDYGVASAMLGFPEKADRFLAVAIAEGYNIPGALIWLGRAYEQQGDKQDAEEMYQAALREASDDPYIPNMVICDFYYRNAMYIMAERYARRAISLNPEKYFGVHMLVHIYLKKRMFKETNALLAENEAAFSDQSDYWLDRVSALEEQGKYYPAIQLLENEPRIAKTMPEEAIRYRLRLYMRRMQRDDARKMIEQLADVYNDIDAEFFNMMFKMADGNYEEAKAMAEHLLAISQDAGSLLYHLVKLASIVAALHTQNQDESQENPASLKKDAEDCLDWLQANGYPIQENKDAIIAMFKT